MLLKCYQHVGCEYCVVFCFGCFNWLIFGVCIVYFWQWLHLMIYVCTECCSAMTTKSNDSIDICGLHLRIRFFIWPMCTWIKLSSCWISWSKRRRQKALMGEEGNRMICHSGLGFSNCNSFTDVASRGMKGSFGEAGKRRLGYTLLRFMVISYYQEKRTMCKKIGKEYRLMRLFSFCYDLSSLIPFFFFFLCLLISFWSIGFWQYVCSSTNFMIRWIRWCWVKEMRYRRKCCEALKYPGGWKMT